jgi:hypothetical protein
MFEKIKSFFQKKVVRTVSWIVFSLAVVALIIGGANIETIKGGAVLAVAIVAAAGALIAFISEQVKK